MQQLCQDFLPVPPDEIAFAMTLFVSAATLRIPRSQLQPATLPSAAGGRMFHLVAWNMRHALAQHPIEAGMENALDFAFVTLWRHYEGDARQRSICARVLGFHSLMVCSGGALVGSWLRACPETPEEVILHPAVVAAVAAAPLGREGLMSKEDFLQTLESIAPTYAGPSI